MLDVGKRALATDWACRLCGRHRHHPSLHAPSTNPYVEANLPRACMEHGVLTAGTILCELRVEPGNCR